MNIPGYVYPPPMVAPGGAYAIRPYTDTIIRAIGPPRGTVIRARGARPVGRMLLRLLHGYSPQHLNGPQAPTHKQFEGASADGPCRGREVGEVPGQIRRRP